MRSWLFLLALLVASALTSAAQAAPCERSGVVSLRDLHVRVGRDELLLSVDHAPVVARSPASGAMHEVEVRLQGAGAGRESAVRGLQSAGLGVSLITDVTPVAHNGCRARKRRRV